MALAKRAELEKQIREWNSARLDLFEIQLVNEGLEYEGVIRFFSLDNEEKYATKCLRVHSSQTAREVIDILVEKFRPDMRMLLSGPTDYVLYETHRGGAQRLVEDDEFPLQIQLSWGEDDRDGRFLLSNRNLQSTPKSEDKAFSRKLSKREQKAIKKQQEQQAKERNRNGSVSASAGSLRRPKDDMSQPSRRGASISDDLFESVSESSFIRTISNPESVRRRRRELEQERREAAAGGNGGGGVTVRVFADTLGCHVPHVDVRLAPSDTVPQLVQQVLGALGLGDQRPAAFALFKVSFQATDPNRPPDVFEQLLSERDSPYDALTRAANNQNVELQFHLRRRNDPPPSNATPAVEELPYLEDMNPRARGSGRPIYLYQGDTFIGSEAPKHAASSYITLSGPKIQKQHCIISHKWDVQQQRAIVQVQIKDSSADVIINKDKLKKSRLYEMKNGDSIVIGKRYTFRLCVPPPRPPSQNQVARPQQLPANQPNATLDRQVIPNGKGALPTSTPMTMTTASNGPTQMVRPASFDDMDQLPLSIEVPDDDPRTFLTESIQWKPEELEFRLAPAYALYLASRYRASRAFAPELRDVERQRLAVDFQMTIVHIVNLTVKDVVSDGELLAFWLANTPELLYFLRYDQDLSGSNGTVRQQLEILVQMIFNKLVAAMRADLRDALPAFFVDTDADVYPQSSQDASLVRVEYVYSILDHMMSLLRRNRVNPALTIQLFSLAFHFINRVLLGKLMSRPDGRQYCTRLWAERLMRRIERVNTWALGQGLELAAECHLTQLSQALRLLLSTDKLQLNLDQTKLNSLHIQALLTNYQPISRDEQPLSRQQIEQMVVAAQRSVDKRLLADGKRIMLDDDDSEILFTFPADGYSCEVLRDIPRSLIQYLTPLAEDRLCRFHVNEGSAGFWNVCLLDSRPKKTPAYWESPNRTQSPPPVGHVIETSGERPEVINVVLQKAAPTQSLGLSIVSVQGSNQQQKHIFISSVSPDGLAAKDGRLSRGDQISKVNGQSVNGLEQQEAARVMQQAGQTVRLEIVKKAALYHNLWDYFFVPEGLSAPPVGPPPPSALPNAKPIPLPGMTDGRTQQLPFAPAPLSDVPIAELRRSQPPVIDQPSVAAGVPMTANGGRDGVRPTEGGYVAMGDLGSPGWTQPANVESLYSRVTKPAQQPPPAAARPPDDYMRLAQLEPPQPPPAAAPVDRRFPHDYVNCPPPPQTHQARLVYSRPHQSLYASANGELDAPCCEVDYRASQPEFFSSLGGGQRRPEGWARLSQPPAEWLARGGGDDGAPLARARPLSSGSAGRLVDAEPQADYALLQRQRQAPFASLQRRVAAAAAAPPAAPAATPAVALTSPLTSGRPTPPLPPVVAAPGRSSPGYSLPAYGPKSSAQGPYELPKYGSRAIQQSSPSPNPSPRPGGAPAARPTAAPARPGIPAAEPLTPSKTSAATFGQSLWPGASGAPPSQPNYVNVGRAENPMSTSAYGGRPSTSGDAVEVTFVPGDRKWAPPQGPIGAPSRATASAIEPKCGLASNENRPNGGWSASRPPQLVLVLPGSEASASAPLAERESLPNSPWERDEIELLKKEAEAQGRRLRDQQIAELQSVPSLNGEEQKRLERLKVERDFDERAEQVQKDLLQSVKERQAQDKQKLMTTSTDSALPKKVPPPVGPKPRAAPPVGPKPQLAQAARDNATPTPPIPSVPPPDSDDERPASGHSRPGARKAVKFSNAPDNVYDPANDDASSGTAERNADSRAASEQRQSYVVDTNAPGVIGAQEIYNDPRSKILAEKASPNQNAPRPEHLPFYDRLKMFNNQLNSRSQQSVID